MSRLFESRRPRLDPVYAQLALAAATCAALSLVAISAGAQIPEVPAKQSAPKPAATDPARVGTVTAPIKQVLPEAAPSLGPAPTPAALSTTTTTQPDRSSHAAQEAIVAPIKRVRPVSQKLKAHEKAIKPGAPGKPKTAAPQSAKALAKMATAKK